MLDLAAGLGQLEIFKILLTLSEELPTDVTVDAAITSGSAAMIGLVWQAIDPVLRRQRLVHFASVAADYHQLDVFKWLFDQAGPDAQREIAQFVIEAQNGEATLHVINHVDIREMVANSGWMELIIAGLSSS